MKKFKLGKILVFALALALAAGNFSMNAKATYCEDLSGYCIDDAAVKAKVDAMVKKIVDKYDDVECVDPEKSTMITFKYTPVKVVKYDGMVHGLDADVRQTLTGKYITEPIIWYVGVKQDGSLYQSLVAPTEVGYYNVVAVYPGSCEWYPSVAYGVVVILPVCEPEVPEEPVIPEEPIVPEEPVDPEDPIVDPEDPEDPIVDPEDPEDPEDPVVDPEDPEDPIVDPEDPEDPVEPEDPTEEPEEEDPAEEPEDEEPAEEPEDEEPVIEDPEVEEKDEDAAPKTGDSANVMLYGVSLVAAFAAIVAVFRKRNA